MRMLKKIALPLLLLIAFVYLYTATSRAILDDGDALYASVARQMVESGDWITPYANGVRFLDKPPMMYWLMGLTYAALGVNEFAARLPSVLAVLGIGLLLYVTGKKYAGQPAGFAAGLAGTFCVGMFLFTIMVFPDILFVFFLMASLCAFLNWYSDPDCPVWPALLFFAALAGTVLSKGMIGIVFPTAIIFLFLMPKREWSRLKRFHLGKGTLLFLALALPWHLLAAKRNPGFLWYFFVNEQVLRFLGKRQPVDYESISVPIFWVLILVWFFPWSAFLPAVRSVFQNIRSRASGLRSLVWLCLSWVVVVLGFFSFSSRVEHYSLPLIPPLALLVGVTLFSEKLDDAQLQRRHSQWIARGFSFLAIIGVAIGLAFCAMLALSMMEGRGAQPDAGIQARHIRAYSFYFAPIFDLPPQIVEHLRQPLLGTCLAFSLGLLGAWWVNRRGWRMQAILVLSAMMAAFCLFAFKSLRVVEDALSSKQFGLALARLYKPGDCAVTLGDFEAANSINFYSPVLLEVYRGTAAVLDWGLRYPDAPQLILSKSDFELRWNGARRTFLLLPDGQIDALHLNHRSLVLRSGGRTLFCNQPVERGKYPPKTEPFNQ
jgi:4-amino-4-deoxy-L-arabinose transferase-like glycosyltransferase